MVDVGRTFSASQYQPSTLVGIMTGLRVALGPILTVIVIAEMVASSRVLGFILNARCLFTVPETLSGTVNPRAHQVQAQPNSSGDALSTALVPNGPNCGALANVRNLRDGLVKHHPHTKENIVTHPYLDHDFMFTIGGKHTGALSGRTAPAINPATEEVLVHIPHGGPEDVDLAVSAAEQAREDWQALGWSGRAKVLRKLAGVLEDELERFAVLDSLDGGNPVKAMRLDAAAAIASLRFFTGLASEVKGNSLPPSPETVVFTLREPFGVVGRIVAYNHPFMFAVSNTAAALVSGNTVVLKPSDHTALSALVLGQVAAEILPPGVFNVVAGPADVGAALVQHPRVPRVAFTGSVSVARRILVDTAAEIKPVTLELGGKNPMIVCDDVDVAKAARAAVAGMNFSRSQGQSCQSNSRVFVHDNIYEEFVDLAAQHLATLKMGDPTSEETDIGPVSFEAHRDNVLRYIRIGTDEGARLIMGGPDAQVPRKGFFVAPTIFADVRPDMVIAQEEIFGPVMGVLRWSDEEQVLADANAVDHGLTASVWTRDVSRAYKMATRLETGYVWINKVGPRAQGAPFGGYKHSGMGKEGSIEELMSFTREKVIDLSF